MKLPREEQYVLAWPVGERMPVIARWESCLELARRFYPEWTEFALGHLAGQIQELVEQAEPASDISLADAVAELREIHKRSDWAQMDDPYAELHRIRYGDDE